MKNMENKKCNLCPRKCNIDRKITCGFCKAPDKIIVAKYQKHFYEEPCISGTKGSGTIFFAGCNLRCKFCQNYKISRNAEGTEYTANELAELFLKLQNEKVHNINLVSPTIYVDKIKEAIKIAKQNGLTIPIIYNTSGYEDLETIKGLNGLIDVYLPDFKYASNMLSKKYSLANNYVENVEKCLIEMKRQVGNPKFDKNGIIKSGLIIRHLILPNNTINSKLILKWIKDNLGIDTYVSLMAQYFPTAEVKNDDRINRKITKEELDEVYNYMISLNLKNGYVKEYNENDNEEKYVPEF